MRTLAGALPPFEWASVARPLPGEATSGDVALVLPTATGALAALVDGLGHGPLAAQAALAAAEAIRANPDAATDQLVTACHEALRRTRGAVLSVAHLDVANETVWWSGVGNVCGVVVRRGSPRQHLLVQGGLVGGRIPRVRIAKVSFRRGDLLVIASDGVRPDFAAILDGDDAPCKTVAKVLERFGLATDDATVLSVRWTGP